MWGGGIAPVKMHSKLYVETFNVKLLQMYVLTSLYRAGNTMNRVYGFGKLLNDLFLMF